MNQIDNPKYGFLQRIRRALGPIAAGILLDFVDMATFGPIGIFGGWLLGAAVGFWIASIYGFSTQTKINFAVLGAAYCMIPTTEFFPLATIIAATAGFFERPPGPPTEQKDPNQPPRKHVDSKVK